MDAGEQAGSVTSKSESAEDVTTQYMDIEARLDNSPPSAPVCRSCEPARQPTDLLRIESSPERCPVPDRELPEPALNPGQPAGLLLHREHHP